MPHGEDMPLAQTRSPIISIGVATYNRNELLKETLGSVLSQANFGDFEILVGNNFVSAPVSADSLGVQDSRIRFFNHRENLGQRGNMNFLLGQAKGRFFTWLNDDDLYRESFLERFAEALKSFPDGQAFFSTYEIFHGEKGVPPVSSVSGQISRPEPAEFLERYLAKELLVIGCYGIFDTEYLRKLGGMPVLGDGPLFYADNLLAVLAICGGRSVLISEPLVLFRAHDGSVSNRSGELRIYCRLQRSMFDRCAEQFVSMGYAQMRRRNLYLLARWFLDDALSVALRTSRLSLKEFLHYSSLVAHFSCVLKTPLYSMQVWWIFLKRLIRVALGRARAGTPAKL